MCYNPRFANFGVNFSGFADFIYLATAQYLLAGIYCFKKQLKRGLKQRNFKYLSSPCKLGEALRTNLAYVNKVTASIT